MSGAPWCDLPNTFGPYTTGYNRLVRWRRAGVRDKIMSALVAAYGAAVAAAFSLVEAADRTVGDLVRIKRSKGRSIVK